MAVHSGEAALNSTKRLLLSPTEPTPVRKFIPQVDFELDDLDADEERYLDIYRKVAVHESMLVPLKVVAEAGCGQAGMAFDLLVQPVMARLCMVATAWTAWWSPSPFWRQARRIFQFFMRAKVCSTRARTRRCSALSSSWPRRSGRPALLRCGTIKPAGSQVGAVCDDRCPGRDAGQIRFRKPVNVSTHNGSARNTSPIKEECQYTLGARNQDTLWTSRHGSGQIPDRPCTQC